MDWILEASLLAVEQISLAEQMGEKEGLENLHLPSLMNPVGKEGVNFPGILLRSVFFSFGPL